MRSTGPKHQALMSRRRRNGRFPRRSAAILDSWASPSRTSRPTAMLSTPRSPPRSATSPARSKDLGHHVQKRAPTLATDPTVVITTIVGGNTSLTVRMIEQRIGRAMTEHDLEILTRASAHKAQKTTATDYVAAQLAAFQISRVLATFFETCDVFLSPTR